MSHEHITFLTLVWGCLSMAFKDALGTLLVVAESRGRGNIAGLLDAGSDLAQVLVNVIGAGAVIKYGWDYKTIGILAAMMVTSYVGTRFWTGVGRRWMGREVHAHAEITQLTDRLSSIEAALLARGIEL